MEDDKVDRPPSQDDPNSGSGRKVINIREYARANPVKLLGGISALVIAAGLMGRRRNR